MTNKKEKPQTLPRYQKPRVTSFTEAQLLEELGPAQALVSCDLGRSCFDNPVRPGPGGGSNES